MSRKEHHHGGNLSCSFCGKGQREVRKLIAGPTVYICDECIRLCNDIIAEESERDEGRPAVSLPTPAEIKKLLGRLRGRTGQGQEGPLGRGLQPLQAGLLPQARESPEARSEPARPRGRRAPEVQHPPRRPHRLWQDAARSVARPLPQRPVHHRRRHQPYRGRVRGRGRREHHPEPAPQRRLRRRKGRPRHRLHRRDRQDREEGRSAQPDPGRRRRGRAAGAPQDHRGDPRQRHPARREEVQPAGVHPGRYLQRPLHRRRRLHRPRAGDTAARGR